MRKALFAAGITLGLICMLCYSLIAITFAALIVFPGAPIYILTKANFPHLDVLVTDFQFEPANSILKDSQIVETTDFTFSIPADIEFEKETTLTLFYQNASSKIGIATDKEGFYFELSRLNNQDPQVEEKIKLFFIDVFGSEPENMYELKLYSLAVSSADFDLSDIKKCVALSIPASQKEMNYWGCSKIYLYNHDDFSGFINIMEYAKGASYSFVRNEDMSTNYQIVFFGTTDPDFIGTIIDTIEFKQ